MSEIDAAAERKLKHNASNGEEESSPYGYLTRGAGAYWTLDRDLMRKDDRTLADAYLAQRDALADLRELIIAKIKGKRIVNECKDETEAWVKDCTNATIELILEEVDALPLVAAKGESKPSRPRIVCLCGSTRFIDTFRKAEFGKTLAGEIVLTIGCDTKSDGELFKGPEGDAIKAKLDMLHKQKIDLADYILVLNVGGYIGDSTRSEIAHAKAAGKPIEWLEPVKGEEGKSFTPTDLPPLEPYCVCGHGQSKHGLGCCTRLYCTCKEYRAQE